MSFFAELKRRHVFKVAAAYAVVGWLLVQIVVTVEAPLNLPDWVDTLVIVLLAVGFPVAMILTWAFDLTPAGVVRAEPTVAGNSDPPGTVPATTGFAINLAVIGVLAALLVLIGLFVFVRDDSAPIVSDEDGRDTMPATAGGIPEVLPNSIAVLRCENLSPDPEQAYFADGIHEEIISKLRNVASLSVISRTSVLQYADAPPPISQIARELNVESVMECTVRIAGDAFMVTARLVDPDTNTQLWDADYPGSLSDLSTLFAMQADVAMNIANALEAVSSLPDLASIEKMPTASPTAYAFYLRALSAQNQGSADYYTAINQAIEADPNFALAYASRAVNSTFELVGVGVGSTPEEVLELERRVYADAERALSLDDTLGLAYAAQAVVHQANWRGATAELAFQRALQLSPNDVYVLLLYGRFKRFRGEYEDAVRLTRRASELDPNDYSLHAQLAFIYRDAADWDPAVDEMQAALAGNPSNLAWNVNLGYIEAARDNDVEAVRILQRAELSAPLPVFRLAQIAHAYALAGRSDDARRIFTDFEERATAEGVSNARWAQAYIAVSDYQQALQRIEFAVNERLPLDQAPLVALAANSSGDLELDSNEFRVLFDSLWDDR